MASTAILFFIMGLLHLHYCYEDFEEEGLKLINQIRTIHRAPLVKLEKYQLNQARRCAELLWKHNHNDPEHGCRFEEERESVYVTYKGTKDRMTLVREAINHWKEGCNEFDESVKTELTGTFNAWNFAYMVWKGAEEFGIAVYDERDDAFVVAKYGIAMSLGGVKKNVFKGNC